MHQGTIIILNGPSASGKSSIQNEFQKICATFYLKAGIDTFFDNLIPEPDLSQFETTKFFAQYTKDNELIRSVSLAKDPLGYQTVPLIIGPAGDRIISGMHHALAAYAREGNNVIVDYILYKPEFLANLLNALNAAHVYLIGMFAPLEILEEREKKRATSPIGHARSHFDTVHQGMIYDLKLDVSYQTPKESAQKIQKFIEYHSHPIALKKLLKSL